MAERVSGSCPENLFATQPLTEKPVFRTPYCTPAAKPDWGSEERTTTNKRFGTACILH